MLTYQFRIKESTRKLDKTLLNIKEVQALRREIAPHLAFLKKQVQVVEKAREMREDLRNLYRTYLSNEGTYINKETKITLICKKHNHEFEQLFKNHKRKKIGDKQEQNIWKEYPIVEVGSYEQTTNNIRYPDNPDEGTCTPAEFCNVFYKNAKHLPSNISSPLHEVTPEQGDLSRINYYWTSSNMLPFTTNGELAVTP